MPDTGTAPKKSGEIMGMKKEYVYIGGGILVLVLVVVVYSRSKAQSAAAASATTVTDPAGNVCTALSPTSGYCPGTPEDLAYQGTGVDSTAGADSASYVGGQIIGYDQYGNPIYSSSGSGSNTVPGSFTSNAEWAQAAQTELTTNDPNTDSATISAALGVYINGGNLTAAQVSIVQQAIAFEGSPPVGGTNGYPPGMHTGSTGTATSATNPVKGLHTTDVAFDNITVAWEASKGATSYNVTCTLGGKQVAKHSVTGLTDKFVGLKQKTKYSIRVWAAPDPTGATGKGQASVSATTK